MTPPYPQPSSLSLPLPSSSYPTSTGRGEGPAGGPGPAFLTEHAQPASQRPGAQIQCVPSATKENGSHCVGRLQDAAQAQPGPLGGR